MRAAHATTPDLAAAAGIAVKGAIVLASELARRHSPKGAKSPVQMICMSKNAP